MLHCAFGGDGEQEYQLYSNNINYNYNIHHFHYSMARWNYFCSEKELSFTIIKVKFMYTIGLVRSHPYPLRNNS
jgi:hypothetical protein